MKKMMMGVAAAAGITSVASAAELAATDAQFMFGASNVDAVAMTGAEMVGTQGQLLGLTILDPVLNIVGSLPLVGPIVSGLLDTVDGLLSGLLGGGLPLVGGLLGGGLPLLG
ncbi:hypothetical protein WCX18_02280 [Sulfurimonas sp. HSL1-2]|uniref:hypothetical protein n=1 Tax=Thiomicrolovo zhangzhouensis TaxID=3131933 RepID=UPI0031F89B0F